MVVGYIAWDVQDRKLDQKQGQPRAFKVCPCSKAQCLKGGSRIPRPQEWQSSKSSVLSHVESGEGQHGV